MLNPYLTPPSRSTPAWLRALLVLVALAWLGAMLWHILQVREHDGVLVALGQGTHLSEQRVASALWALAVAAYVVAICAAVGLDLVVRNFQGTLAPTVAFPVHLALGLAFFSFLFFLLGLAAGGYRLWALTLVLLAGGVNILRWHRYRPEDRGEVFQNPPETPLWFFLVVALTVIAMAAALAPATAHDDLVYHLENPVHMLRAGHMTAPTWNLYAHFPNLLHHLYVPMLALDPLEAAPRLLNVFLGVLVAYLLYRIGGFWFSPRAGGVAGLLFLSTPAVLDAWPTAGLDVAGTFFVTVAMLSLVVAPMERSLAHARLAGVCAGCALLCRLSAVSALAGLLVLVVARWWRYRREAEDVIGLYRPRLARLVTAFVWPLLAVQVPFMLRAWLEVGNPVYPFLFGGEGWSRDLTAGAVRWQRAMGMGHALRDYLLLPWRLVARGGGDYGRFAGVLQPWMILLAPLVLAAPQHLRKVTLLLLMLAATAALWFQTSQQARFLMPALPWAALIGGLGFDTLIRGFAKGMRPWASGALGLLMVGTGVLLVPPRDLQRFSENVQVVLTRGESREDYLRHQLDIWPTLDWLNRRPGAEVQGVLLLWDNRGHHLDVPWVADAILEVPRTFLRWRDLTAGQILEDLRHGGEFPISHIVVNTASRDEILTHRPFGLRAEEHGRIWSRLSGHLTEVFRNGAFVVYRVD